jgi:hypothetical protein
MLVLQTARTKKNGRIKIAYVVGITRIIPKETKNIMQPKNDWKLEKKEGLPHRDMTKSILRG